MLKEHILSKKPEERIFMWREFRDSLPDNNDEILQNIVDFWKHTPQTIRSIDIYAPDTWPNIWEMITIGDFCRSSLAIAMHQTLEQSKNNPFECKLLLVNDDQGILIILQIDDKILNYSHGEIVDKNTLKLNVISTYYYDGNNYLPE